MRKLMSVLVATVVALANAGCLVIVGAHDPMRARGGKSVIEVDDEWYVVDVEAKTVKKLEHGPSVSVEVTPD